MSTAVYGNVPCEFAASSFVASFIAADTTKLKVIVDAQPAVAAAGTQPLKQGGCTVIDAVATSSDAASKDMQLYLADVRTTVAAAATGVVATTTSTITRVTGSWLTDGFRVGMTVALFAAMNLDANNCDGVVGVISAVTATVITVSGTPFTANAAVPNTTRVCAMSPHFRTSIPANSGLSAIAASVGLLGAANDGSTIRTELKLGTTQMLVAGLAAAASALPAYVNARATIARY